MREMLGLIGVSVVHIITGRSVVTMLYQAHTYLQIAFVIHIKIAIYFKWKFNHKILHINPIQ